MVLPWLTPVTSPLLSMLAIPIAVEDQTPPAVALLKVELLPIQTLAVPAIAANAGAACIVIVKGALVALHTPLLVVNVMLAVWETVILCVVCPLDQV